MARLSFTLSIATLRALAEGEVLVMEIEDQEMEVLLRCDPDEVIYLRDAINASMMEFLPTPTSIN
jgi:hypothetical protein